MDLIKALDALELGGAHQIGNAHFIPILCPSQAVPRDYLTAHEALQKGLLDLRDSGDINAVLVFNRAKLPVLFIAGMDVHAEGTQSRIIIGSHLVPPKIQIELPCRCTHDIHPIREYQCLMTDVEHYSVAAPGVRGVSITQSVAGQDRVWSKVHGYREKLKTSKLKGKQLLDASETSSRLSHVQGKAMDAIRDEIAQITPQQQQVGLAVISEGRVQAVEVFDNPKTYQAFHNHLVERFAFEIAAPKPTPPKKVTSIRDTILQELQKLSAKLEIQKGKGTAQAQGKILGTLQDKDKKLVHLCLEKL
ncbi:MAG: ARPP-1 family domain-containing protein [Candidatus Hodarchaeota archaeon]